MLSSNENYIEKEVLKNIPTNNSPYNFRVSFIDVSMEARRPHIAFTFLTDKVEIIVFGFSQWYVYTLIYSWI
jgi:hypothetical protein